MSAVKRSVWTTKDGQAIPISKMETSHIVNTVAFLRRRVMPLRMELLSRMSGYIGVAPEGAAMACQDEADAIMDMEDDAFLAAYIPQWKALIRELARRTE